VVRLFLVVHVSDLKLVGVPIIMNRDAIICCKRRTLQVGYMSVPYQNKDMTQHQQYVVVRNERGKKS